MTEASSPGPRIPASIGASSYLSASLAGLLVLELLILGVVAYGDVQAALAPEQIADRAEAAIRENYPEFRQELIQQVHAQSPAIAERVSRRLTTAAPEAREWLEAFTAQQLETGLDEATELSAEQFRQLLRENREAIVQAFEKVEAAPEEARELVLSLEKDIEQDLGIDLQKQAQAALTIHQRLNDKLARLNDDDATLEPQELLERRIVRILKTMQDSPPRGT